MKPFTEERKGTLAKLKKTGLHASVEILDLEGGKRENW